MLDPVKALVLVMVCHDLFAWLCKRLARVVQICVICIESHGIPPDLPTPVPLQYQVKQAAGGEDTRWPSGISGPVSGRKCCT